MFAEIRQLQSLASYNGSYDPEAQIPSGAGNIMEGTTTTNSDIWPGGHGTPGWTNGRPLPPHTQELHAVGSGRATNRATCTLFW